ncbi:hypothetical protein [Candidatus Methanoprimaticola sp. MG2]|uniref:hypothetical protein n=1 Tax=Candidatus Methanoprimaticola sp. MG2 TaxID=3228838 RepID=UPI0039C5EDE0
MALLTTITTAIVGVATIAALFVLLGHDIDATARFLVGNWSTVLLGMQIAVSYILTASGHRVAGGIVAGTAILTVIGKVIAFDRTV